MKLAFPWVIDIDPRKKVQNDAMFTHTRIKFLHNNKQSTNVDEFVQLNEGQVIITELNITGNNIVGNSWFNLPFSVKHTSPIPYIERLKSVSHMFSYCNNLEHIPSDLFKFNPQLVRFNECFTNCTKLKTIPDDLFKYNVEAMGFSDCFRNCKQIKNIPEGLFSNTNIINEINLNGCFKNCEGITKLEHSIFPDNFRLTKTGIELIFGANKIELTKTVQLLMI